MIQKTIIQQRSYNRDFKRYWIKIIRLKMEKSKKIEISDAKKKKILQVGLLCWEVGNVDCENMALV